MLKSLTRLEIVVVIWAYTIVVVGVLFSGMSLNEILFVDAFCIAACLFSLWGSNAIQASANAEAAEYEAWADAILAKREG